MASAVDSCPRCGHFQSSYGGCSPDFLDRDQLRRRIAQLNALIAGLDAERRHLQAQSDAIIYPVLSLPPELTSLIFIQSLPSASLPRPSPLDSPLLVAQICRQWRDIAIGTPELWKSIALVDSHSPELLAVWLLRSARCPLTISLDDVNADRASTLLKVCKPHADRWEDIDLCLPDEAMLGLRDIPRMPLLRKTSVSTRGAYRPGSKERFDFTEVPLLRVAVIQTSPDLEFVLPWNQLASLTLSNPIQACNLSILRECSCLETLDLSAIDSALVPSDQAVLFLGSLTSLTFPSHFCAALDHLRLPRLAHMRIRETTPFRQEEADALRCLIAHSSPPLQHLCLHLRYPIPQMLTRCLDSLSLPLRALELRCGNAAHVRPILEILRARATLPDLKTLSIAGGRIFDSDYLYLAETLAARVPGSLEAFSLLVQTYGRAGAQRDLPRKRAMPHFRALAAAGLRIRFAVAGKTSVDAEVWMDTLVAGDFP